MIVTIQPSVPPPTPPSRQGLPPSPWHHPARVLRLAASAIKTH